MNGPQHAPERPGPDGLGYGKCTGCGEIWPCQASRPATATPAALHAWLVTRWTEHRALAQEATPGKWDAAHGGNPRSSGVYAYMGPRIAEMHSGVEPYSYDAEHIAANDPAHVTAVCDAALRRLARHAPEQHVELDYDGDDLSHAVLIDGPYWICETCSADEQWRKADWPCVEALDDAAPWTHRDDFPPELRRPA